MFSSERLKGIDVFVCVADAGSFRAAAERLNLTASAISKAIARLEDRLQVRLFERTTRRLALTDAGARSIEPALAYWLNWKRPSWPCMWKTLSRGGECALICQQRSAVCWHCR